MISKTLKQKQHNMNVFSNPTRTLQRKCWGGDNSEIADFHRKPI